MTSKERTLAKLKKQLDNIYKEIHELESEVFEDKFVERNFNREIGELIDNERTALLSLSRMEYRRTNRFKDFLEKNGIIFTLEDQETLGIYWDGFSRFELKDSKKEESKLILKSLIEVTKEEEE
jgi:hypothetical protein